MSHGFRQHSRLATCVRVCLQIEPGLLSVFSRCFESRTMRTVAVQTRVAAVYGAPACVDFPAGPAEETPVVSQTAAQPKSMFPSWHKVFTRRSGMCNRATHRHRSAQTDRFWRPPPQAGALPCPKRLLGETRAALACVATLRARASGAQGMRLGCSLCAKSLCPRTHGSSWRLSAKERVCRVAS